MASACQYFYTSFVVLHNQTKDLDTTSSQYLHTICLIALLMNPCLLFHGHQMLRHVFQAFVFPTTKVCYRLASRDARRRATARTTTTRAPDMRAPDDARSRDAARASESASLLGRRDDDRDARRRRESDDDDARARGDAGRTGAIAEPYDEDEGDRRRRRAKTDDDDDGGAMTRDRYPRRRS